MDLTLDSCFSTSCGLCSTCCRGTHMGYNLPLSQCFFHTKEAIFIINTVEKLKKDKLKHRSELDILKKVMEVHGNMSFIPLDKRIQSEKKKIEENEKMHQLRMNTLY